jgi:hypothetical protein
MLSKVPGTFFFSVLDNGVTSLEFWRIVDVAEDLSWAVFYYSGAASAAGQVRPQPKAHTSSIARAAYRSAMRAMMW